VPSERSEIVRDNIPTISFTAKGFSPLIVRISSGERVRFTNMSEQAIKIEAAGKGAETEKVSAALAGVGVLLPNETVVADFSDVGVYEYGNAAGDGQFGVIFVVIAAR